MAIIDRRGATVSATDPPVATDPNPDLAYKAPVRTATTGSNIALSGLGTLDGLALADGDRVLVKDQTDARENGIYIASSGLWQRAPDAADNSRLTDGVQVYITDGTQNHDNAWALSAANPIVLGTSDLVWVNTIPGDFIQPATGAVQRSFLAKARDFVDAADFGVGFVFGTDYSTQMQAAINYLVSLGGGTLYGGPGVTLAYGLTIPTNVAIRLLGENWTLTAGSHDQPIITCDGGWSQFEYMYFIGKGSDFDDRTVFGATQPVIRFTDGAAAAGMRHCRIKGGAGLVWSAGDVRLFDVHVEDAYGSSHMYVGSSTTAGAGAGSRIKACTVDQDWVVSPVAPMTINAWASLHNYSVVGTVVSLVQGAQTYLIQLTNTGTSGSSQPALQNYKLPIGDGTATWQLLRPEPHYGLQLDSNSFEVLVEQLDSSGPHKSSIACTQLVGGNAPDSHTITDCILSATTLHIVDLQVGTNVTVKGCKIAGAQQNDASGAAAGVRLGASWTSSATISGNRITNTYEGVLIGGGVLTIVDDNRITTVNGHGVYVAPNVTEFQVTDNTIAATVADILVDTGTSDVYIVDDNLTIGAGTHVSDGGSGTNKLVQLYSAPLTIANGGTGAATAAGARANLSVREQLTGNRTYFVRTDGSDSNNGLSNTAGGAFLTFAHAITVLAGIDPNGFTVTLDIGNFTWSAPIDVPEDGFPPGQYAITGHSATISISTGLNACMTFRRNPCTWTVTGCTLTSSNATTDGIFAQEGAKVFLGTGMTYGSFNNGYQIAALNNAIVKQTDNYTISGGGAGHIYCDDGSYISHSGLTITLTGTPAFGVAFTNVHGDGAILHAGGNTYSGSATGARFSVNLGGLIDTSGAGVNYFPGNSAGSFASGGIYDNNHHVDISSGNLGLTGTLAVGNGGTGVTTLAALYAALLETANPQLPFTEPFNLQLNASVGSNLLTIAVKGNNGSDPSASNPVLIPFRDPTIANGGPIWRTVQAALSISTNATGATLGTVSSVPFRLWVVAFDNGGTVVLALWQSVTGGGTPTLVSALDEATPQSTTGISGSATAAGTFYTPNGTSLSSKSFRVLGYVEYASGLGSAGFYASTPTKIQLAHPGIKRPGDIVQRAASSTSSTTTTTSSTPAASANAISITPTSAANLVHVTAHGSVLDSAAGSSNMYCGIRRGTSTDVGAGGVFGGNVTNFRGPAPMEALDAPGTTSSTTYTVYIRNGDNATSVSYPDNNGGFGSKGAMFAEEVMA